MICQCCHRPGPWLCRGCRAALRPANERLLPGGLRLIAAFEHTGPARALVAALKYRGVAGYEQLVADLLASRVPPHPLVPVPRAISRRIEYGVDAATVLAGAIATRVGVPVLHLLRSPLHRRPRAGSDHRRPVAPFVADPRPSSPLVLVDDVVTTGATLRAASDALGGVVLAVAANMVPLVSSLSGPDPTFEWPQY
ncbi:MAG: hypothetical protein L0Z47_06965 [Actinobacteria bacterium]|nr:hypothetical protein [Actinomycetota bacterium]